MGGGGTAEVGGCRPDTDVAADSPARPPAASRREVFAAVYASHYRSLVQMAALLCGSVVVAEDLVQDAFVRVLARPGRAGPDRPVAYLRTTVVNLARSRWRRARVGADKLAFLAVRDAEVEAGGGGGFDRLTIVEALRALPTRQREVVVLRYLLDLPVEEVAATLGISAGTVKSYTARGLSALRPQLEDTDETH